MNFEKCKVLSILDGVLHEKGMKKKDENYAYHCPKCHHHKRKLEIDINSQVFHCWTCDFKGRKIRNVLLFVKADRHYITEIDKIYGGGYKERDNEDDEVEIVSLPVDFKSLSIPTNSIEYKQALCYIKGRGITGYDILKYNIGYCEEGRYKNRIVIPSYDENGILNFFSSRTYYDSNLTYMNSETSKDIIGFELFVDWNEPITIVEGAFDAIAIKRNVIPLFGKTLSTKLQTKIIENNVPEIYLVLDNDALKSTIRIAEEFLSNGRKIKVVRLEEKDPSKIGFENMMGILKQAEEMDFSSLIKMKMGF